MSKNARPVFHGSGFSLTIPDDKSARTRDKPLPVVREACAHQRGLA